MLRLGTGNRIVLKNSQIASFDSVDWETVEKNIFAERKH